MHAIEESIEHLQIIASHLSEGDVATIDVTHGLRFHPMLCIVVAQYLSNIQNHNRRHCLRQFYAQTKWDRASSVFDRDAQYSRLDRRAQ